MPIQNPRVPSGEYPSADGEDISCTSVVVRADKRFLGVGRDDVGIGTGDEEGGEEAWLNGWEGQVGGGEDVC